MTAPDEQDKKIKGLTMIYNAACVGALVFSMLSLYAVNNLDDGEMFDFHQEVPKIMQEFKELPEMRKVALVAELNEMADKKEEGILEAAWKYSLVLGVNMLFFYRAMNNAIKEKDGPRVG